MSDIIYSQRLGQISGKQFQSALSKFDLGEFIEAVPFTQGLFGQNVMVKSSKGNYVLRGSPHYPWQFPKEKYGAELLHKLTKVPVAYPYMHDPGTDIFGWNYILMPFMPGISPMAENLAGSDREEIAYALGVNLCELHQCKLDFSGEYDLSMDCIKPLDKPYHEWFIADTEQFLERTISHSGINSEDIKWVRDFLSDKVHLLQQEFSPCFVMNDYNPGNVSVDKIEGKWNVTGLFDLMEYYFGDGDADLVRLISYYIENQKDNAKKLIQEFLKGYSSSKQKEADPTEAGIAEKIKLFMLRDRLIVWEYGTRPEAAWFPENASFKEYAERYMAF